MLCLLWRFKVYRCIFIHHIITDPLLQPIMHAFPLHSKLLFLNQAFCDYANLKDNEVHPITDSKSVSLNKSWNMRKLTLLVLKILGNFHNSWIFHLEEGGTLSYVILVFSLHLFGCFLCLFSVTKYSPNFWSHTAIKKIVKYIKEDFNPDTHLACLFPVASSELF